LSLLALCLLIFQTIVPAPSAHVATEGPRVHSSSVAPAVAVAAQRGSETRDAESLSQGSTHGDAVAWTRDARSYAGLLTARGDAPVRTPVYGGPIGQLSMEAAFAASVRVRTLDGSHAVSARGALLPYFATAPPLRG
jgi:hypothetical protein